MGAVKDSKILAEKKEVRIKHSRAGILHDPENQSWP